MLTVSILSWSWQCDCVCLVMELAICLSCHGVGHMWSCLSCQGDCSMLMLVLSWSWPYMIMLFLSRRLQHVNACLVVELAVCIGLSCHGTGRLFRPDLSRSCQWVCISSLRVCVWAVFPSVLRMLTTVFGFGSSFSHWSDCVSVCHYSTSWPIQTVPTSQPTLCWFCHSPSLWPCPFCRRFRVTQVSKGFDSYLRREGGIAAVI